MEEPFVPGKAQSFTANQNFLKVLKEFFLQINWTRRCLAFDNFSVVFVCGFSFEIAFFSSASSMIITLLKGL
ncbi:hypothetical protein ACQ4N7_28245 [Nodosilinea sp. AN01ver1]|uniref:hypothetical protein n=1 Tax=Nodosilinea sp. AN01ver1 TaxID=3423362 RepID=UPI003D316F0F